MSRAPISILLDNVAPMLLIAGPLLGYAASRAAASHPLDRLRNATAGGSLASVLLFLAILGAAPAEVHAPGFWNQAWLFFALFTGAGTLVGAVGLLLEHARKARGLLSVLSVFGAVVALGEALSIAKGFVPVDRGMVFGNHAEGTVSIPESSRATVAQQGASSRSSVAVRRVAASSSAKRVASKGAAAPRDTQQVTAAASRDDVPVRGGAVPSAVAPSGEAAPAPSIQDSSTQASSTQASSTQASSSPPPIPAAAASGQATLPLQNAERSPCPVPLGTAECRVVPRVVRERIWTGMHVVVYKPSADRMQREPMPGVPAYLDLGNGNFQVFATDSLGRLDLELEREQAAKAVVLFCPVGALAFAVQGDSMIFDDIRFHAHAIPPGFSPRVPIGNWNDRGVPPGCFGRSMRTH